jgi:hypothetical protein
MERLARNAPAVLMVVALAVSAVLTLALTAHLTFFGDTWEFLMNRRDFSAEAVLKPHNEHIVVFPVLIEQSLLRLFGMTSATPEYAVLTVGLLATASLVFAYVKRRVGPWLGLFAAVLVLFLGPAWEVLLWPFEIGFVGSMLFGLAMLLALERRDRRGDIAACVFLAASLGFSSLGIAFVVAAGVSVLQGPRVSWRSRAYLVVIPLLLYAAWYVGWGHEAETHITLRNLLASPRFLAESIAVAVGAVFGLGTSPFGGSIDPVWGRSILIAMVLLLAYRQKKKPGFFPGLWPVAAAAATSWLLTAFNAVPGREPTTSRYQYAGVIFVLLLLANLLRDARLEKRAIAVVGAIAVLAVGPNLVVLRDGQKWLTQQTVLTRADTAAIEIAHRTVDPEFSLTPEVAGTPTLVDVSAGKLLPAVEEYGSPAYSLTELASAPEEGRRQADIVLAKALPISSATQAGGSGQRGAAERCVTLPGDGASSQREVPLRPGLTTIELAAGPQAQLTLRRFAENEFPVALEGGYGGAVTALRIPADTSPRPWFLHVEAQQQAWVCRPA